MVCKSSQSCERISYCDFLHVTTFCLMSLIYFEYIKGRIIGDREASPGSALFFFLMVGI